MLEGQGEGTGYQILKACTDFLQKVLFPHDLVWRNGNRKNNTTNNNNKNSQISDFSIWVQISFWKKEQML